MADRLQELLQQRALIREHLEWLDAEIIASAGNQRALIREHLKWIDAEIAASSGRPGEMPRPSPEVSTPRVILPVTPPVAAAVAAPHVPDEAEALIARLAAEENPQPIPTKKGCWILFCTVLGACVAIGVALLLYFYRG